MFSHYPKSPFAIPKGLGCLRYATGQSPPPTREGVREWFYCCFTLALPSSSRFHLPLLHCKCCFIEYVLLPPCLTQLRNHKKIQQLDQIIVNQIDARGKISYVEQKMFHFRSALICDNLYKKAIRNAKNSRHDCRFLQKQWTERL